MTHGRGTRRAGGIKAGIGMVAMAVMSTIAGSCRGGAGEDVPRPSSTVLRVGVAQLSATNPSNGLRQLSQNLSIESLARPGEDGRMQPSLSESWVVAKDGRSLTVKLRAGVKFHDGSPLDAAAAVAILPGSLRAFLGPLADAVEHVSAVGDMAVEMGFRESSPFFVDALEAQIQKPGTSPSGTGPFVVAPNSAKEMLANKDYYLGRPILDRIEVESFPSVRAAWAELLRDRLDMLYEVGPDALQSMENATTVSVFPVTRRYQHLIVLNTKVAALRSRETRRAISMALDRDTLVKQAMNGRGLPSSGPVWPRNWAFGADTPRFAFDPKGAAALLAPRGNTARRSGNIRFTCLVPSDAVNGRIALEAKRQLELVGVEMDVEEVTPDQVMQRVANRDYDAALLEGVSGPTLLRPYQFWYSSGPFNPGGLGNTTIDTALDHMRHAASDDDTRKAVAELQQAFMDDPPAIFLAWSVRARAVSKRFAVVQAEPGRDVLSTLRLWKPAADASHASRN